MTVYKVGPQNGQYYENNDPDSFVTSVYLGLCYFILHKRKNKCHFWKT